MWNSNILGNKIEYGNRFLSTMRRKTMLRLGYRTNVLPDYAQLFAGLEWNVIRGIKETTGIGGLAQGDVPTASVEVKYLNPERIPNNLFEEGEEENLKNRIKEELKCITLNMEYGYQYVYERNLVNVNDIPVLIINTKASIFKGLTETVETNSVAELYATDLPTDDTFEKVQTIALVCNPYHRVALYKYKATENSPYKYLLITTGLPSEIWQRLWATILLDHIHTLPEELRHIQPLILENKVEEYYTAISNYIKNIELNKQKAIIRKSLEELQERKDYMKNEIQSKFDGIQNVIEKKLEEDINAIKVKITNIMNHLYEEEKRLKAMSYRKFLAENQTDETIEDAITILKNTAEVLHFDISENNIMSIIVHTSIKYFEEDDFKALKASRRSNIYNIQSKELQRVLDKIFIDRILEVSLITGVSIDLNGEGFTSNSDSDITFANPNHYLRQTLTCLGVSNPHHAMYNCFGNYVPLIHEAVKSQDYTLIISTALNCMAGINIADSTVFSRFVEYIAANASGNAIIKEVETGDYLTVQEAIDEYGKE